MRPVDGLSGFHAYLCNNEKPKEDLEFDVISSGAAVYHSTRAPVIQRHSALITAQSPLHVAARQQAARARRIGESC
jgi:hypothetical protein